MAGIDSFLGGDRHNERVKKFKNLSVGKSKEEIRELEMLLFKPDESTDYTGEVVRHNINSEFAVKLVFSSQEEWDLLNKYFVVGHYIEKSISKLKLLIDMLKALDNGQLSYNKKDGSFSTPGSINNISEATNDAIAEVSEPQEQCVSRRSRRGQ